MVPIKSKNTEEVIRAYLKNVYSISRGSKYVVKDRGGEFTSQQLAWLAKELEFIKLYPSPHTHMDSSVIEHIYSFLKASERKLICNYSID